MAYNSETVELIKGILKSDVFTDADIEAALDRASKIALNRLYPFGAPAGAELPAKYDGVVVDIAVYWLAKQGAEGEVTHAEGGISRTYENAYVPSNLLHEIVPYCGVPK